MASGEPKLSNLQHLTLIKGRRVALVPFKNAGGPIASCAVDPVLPIGLQLVVEDDTCMLTGRPAQASPRSVYQVKACNSQGACSDARIEIAVVDAPTREQRGEIIKVHDARQDLDTPRSQRDNAQGDAMHMGSMIKPHEKFLHQPMGDDSHLTNQAANNPDAEHRAETSPELTPSPSAQLQHQAVLAAKPTITPTPTR